MFLCANKVEMCLKTTTSYQSERAIAVRTENFPPGKVNKDLLLDFKESIRKKTDVATFKQSRLFQVSAPSRLMASATIFGFHINVRVCISNYSGLILTMNVVFEMHIHK